MTLIYLGEPEIPCTSQVKQGADNEAPDYEYDDEAAENQITPREITQPFPYHIVSLIATIAAIR